MRNTPYYPKRTKPDPLLKIGVKKETLAYTDKNTDPNLNFLNRYLYDEERKKLDKIERQKQELSYISKAYEQSHNQNKNLTKKKINVDQISGKIGQENREIQYENYTNSGTSLTTDQLFPKEFKPDIRSLNYHGYNIINNNILGFCDPGQKFPNSSYQNTYLGKQLPDESAGFTPEQYQEYLRLKKNIVMNKEKDLKGHLINMKVPGRGNNIINEEERRRISNEQRAIREREYNRNVQNLALEQRALNKEQVNYLNNKDLEAESKRQYDIYMQELNKGKMRNDNINTNNNNVNPIEKSEERQMSPQQEQYLREREEYERYYQQQMMKNPEMMAPRSMQNPETMDPRLMRNPEKRDPRMMANPETMDPRMMQNPEMMDPRMMPNPETMDPRMMQNPEMIDPRLMQNKEMIDPRLIQNKGTMDPRMMQNPEIMDPRLMQNKEMIDPRMMQNPETMDPRLMQNPEMMDPRMLQKPEMLDPRLMQNKEMMEPTMMQNPEIMDPRMMQNPEMMDPRMLQNPEMLDPRLMQNKEMSPEEIAYYQQLQEQQIANAQIPKKQQMINPEITQNKLPQSQMLNPQSERPLSNKEKTANIPENKIPQTDRIPKLPESEEDKYKREYEQYVLEQQQLKSQIPPNLTNQMQNLQIKSNKEVNIPNEEIQQSRKDNDYMAYLEYLRQQEIDKKNEDLNKVNPNSIPPQNQLPQKTPYREVTPTLNLNIPKKEGLQNNEQPQISNNPSSQIQNIQNSNSQLQNPQISNQQLPPKLPKQPQLIPQYESYSNPQMNPYINPQLNANINPNMNPEKYPPMTEEEYERFQYENYLMEQQRERERLMNQQRGEEVDREYLKNIQNYESIVQNQPTINTKTNEQSLQINPPQKTPSYHEAKKMAMTPNYNLQIQGATHGKITKDNLVIGNPYTNKNYNLGNSELNQNPITHPINSYQFDYNRMYNPLVNNRANSGRLKFAGNRVVGQ